MKIILLMVSSADGKTTKGDIGPTAWNSEEDRKMFSEKLDNASLIIMGSRTYRQSRNLIRASLKPKTLRIVMTRNPQRFESEKVPGQLEFTNEDPSALVERLEEEGYSEAIHVGGANLNSDFFKNKLIAELWLSIEPKIFGVGNGIVGDDKFDINMKLKSVEKLNDQGTLLLKYRVIT